MTDFNYTYTQTSPIELEIICSALISSNITILTYPVLPFELTIESLAVTVGTGSNVRFRPPAFDITLTVLPITRVIHTGNFSDRVLLPTTHTTSLLDTGLFSTERIRGYNSKNLPKLITEMRGLRRDISSMTAGNREVWEEEVVSKISNGDIGRRIIKHEIYNYSAALIPSVNNRVIRRNTIV